LVATKCDERIKAQVGDWPADFQLLLHALVFLLL
jgi:hypothetical protein